MITFSKCSCQFLILLHYGKAMLVQWRIALWSLPQTRTNRDSWTNHKSSSTFSWRRLEHANRNVEKKPVKSPWFSLNHISHFATVEIRFFSEPVPQLRDGWDNTWCYRKPRRFLNIIVNNFIVVYSFLHGFTSECCLIGTLLYSLKKGKTNALKCHVSWNKHEKHGFTENMYQNEFLVGLIII